MAESIGHHAPSQASATIQVTEPTHVIPDNNSEPVLRLKLKKPKSKKKVGWTTDTIDNEHLNKMKSKCCCIYEKPHKFGESSSDTDDECDHCRGHTDKKAGDGVGDPPMPSSTPA